MVIVTGATGHIGNVLVRELLKQGEQVRVLIRPGSTELPLDGLNVEKVYGDIRNIEDLRKAFLDMEVVYHLAAIISIFPGIDPELATVNIEGTKNVGKVCVELKIPKLVYTSSVHAISDHPHGSEITEEVPICIKNAIGKYGKTKAAATLAILDMVKNDNLPAVIVQPAGVIGPYDYMPSQLGLVYNFMINGLFIGMAGAYNFVDVRDVVNGIILAGKKGKIGERYILSGHLLSIQEKKRVIDEILNRKHFYISSPELLCYIGSFFLSPFYKPLNLIPILTNESLEILFSNADLKSDKAQKELGYTIRPFKETMTDIINWTKKNKHLWKKTKHQI
ncbi:MAG: NAD-dependent epimerase/dehydratase family protein [Spirochaetota bacterium]|nr:NAD-dependent epimerase/dehydratase family protein [Spirochaetota bacterium]